MSIMNAILGFGRGLQQQPWARGEMAMGILVRELGHVCIYL